MPISKTRRGGAYISVLAATMLIIMLAAIVLSVTAVSRRLTARYSDTIGLFDLAVAGNEQAFFLLRQPIDSHKEEISYNAWARVVDDPLLGFTYYYGSLLLDEPTSIIYRQFFIEEAQKLLSVALGNNFTRVHFDYHLAWGLDTAIDAGEHVIHALYQAETIVSPGNAFNVTTTTRRNIGDYLSIPIAVQASIIWTASERRAIVLDAHTILTLESNGAIFPFLPGPGENLILFLDEFTLAMVESLRIT